MRQTPPHDRYNYDLLATIPENCSKVVEVGCSTGNMARAYRQRFPACWYVGIEIDPDYAELAREACSEVVSGDVEQLPDSYFLSLFPSDCIVFGDTLEHLRDPWALLARIRKVLLSNACIVACIPNAQHWSVQARLNSGQFRYEDSGLLDRTHLRWFTRVTMIEMFQSAGFAIIHGHPRIFDEPQREAFLPAIRAMAAAQGIDPEQAVADSLALQYVVKAVPV